MTTMAVITPSCRPDLAGFRRLHSSVRRHTDADVKHHVIVPGRDAVPDEDRAVHIQSNTETDDRVFDTVVERLSGASPR
ncbi:hypothetical protein ACFFIO_03660 [Citricoccus parietis]